VLVLLALAARVALFPFESVDYRDYLVPWTDQLAGTAGLGALRQDFANYTPPYLYFLKLASLVPGPPLVPIKLVATGFDLLLAAFVYLLVRDRYPRLSMVPIAALALVLFSPTVLFNGALWAQADSTYTAFLVACLYGLVRQRTALAFAAFGVALAFKLQAAFFLPLLVAVYLLRRGSALYFLVSLGAYGLMMLPAMAAGLSPGEILSTYVRQADAYHSLSMGAPNIYQWTPDTAYDILVPFGFILAVAVIVGLVSMAVLARRGLTAGLLVKLALALVLAVPYVTPKMHDRYFYPADVISIVFAFYNPRYFYVPIVVTLTSLLTYLPFLFEVELVPFRFLTLAMLVPVILVVRDYAQALFGTAREPVGDAERPEAVASTRPLAARFEDPRGERAYTVPQ
jgi:Gpi18-like mannosyltransferase